MPIGGQQVFEAECTITESPWLTIHNGLTGEYYQVNRETGERREVPTDWWADAEGQE